MRWCVITTKGTMRGLWGLILSTTVLAVAAAATSGVYFVRHPQSLVAPPGDRVVFECQTNVPPERVVWLHDGKPLNAPLNLLENKEENNATPATLAGTRESERSHDVRISGPWGTHLAVRVGKASHKYRHQAGDYQCVAWFGAVALTSLPAKLSIASLGQFLWPNTDSALATPWRPAKIDDEEEIGGVPTGGKHRSGVTDSSAESTQGPSQLVEPVGRGAPSAGRTRGSHRNAGNGQDNRSNPKTTVLQQKVWTLDVGEGSVVVIPCAAPLSDPPATVTVYFNGRSLTPNERIRFMTSGNLHIARVTTAEVGNYTCVAANHISGEIQEHSVIWQLRLVKNPPMAPPEFLQRPDTRYIAQIGSNVTLECAVHGWPKATVVWRKDGNEFDKNRYLTWADSLDVLSAQTQDEGTYYCDATQGGVTIRASTILQIVDTPRITKAPVDASVEEGENAILECTAMGKPPPDITWLFNGESVQNNSHVRVLDKKLVVNTAGKRHAGIYQCFATNAVGVAEGAATLQVLPRPVGGPGRESFADSDFEDEEDGDGDEQGAGAHSSDSNLSPSSDRKNKRRQKVMIPPSKPNITRLTDESVMVRWSVPPNEGLSIEFFKVQYKEVTGSKKGARWRTIDEDIPAHIRSYEVTGLRAGQVYKFRIAAVYSNNDNKLGPNSERFLLEKESPKRKPVVSPIITSLKPVSQSALVITWEYPEMETSSVQGFFIYYRSTTSAGDYAKITVLGPTSRSHIVTHLLPETHYDLKMQAFNMAGPSEFSRIFTNRTLGSSTVSPMGTTLAPMDIVSSGMGSSNDQLYLVLGAVLGGLAVLVALFVALYHCRNRQQANRSARQTQPKPVDPALQICLEQPPLPDKYLNGQLSQRNAPSSVGGNNIGIVAPANGRISRGAKVQHIKQGPEETSFSIPQLTGSPRPLSGSRIFLRTRSRDSLGESDDSGDDSLNNRDYGPQSGDGCQHRGANVKKTVRPPPGDLRRENWETVPGVGNSEKFI